MTHTLPNLPYDYAALEPWIDEATMRLHHTKHHQTYVDKLNAALVDQSALADMPLDALLRNIHTLDIPDHIRTAIRNHGGGHANHSLFWQTLGPTKNVDQQLIEEITNTFGSIELFKKAFSEKAAAIFGSGWMWLVRDASNKLALHNTANQDSPRMEGLTPIFGLDVWEHAYYLKYQNKRADYIAAWWNVLTLLP